MSLDEAIRYYSHLADENRRKADIERNDYMDLKDLTVECEQLADWLNELKVLREKIQKLLEKQERETREKPFPFVIGQPAEMFFDGKWEKGKIVAGYRFNDGVVTIETEDGRRLWCGQDRTDIYRPYQENEA